MNDRFWEALLQPVKYIDQLQSQRIDSEVNQDTDCEWGDHVYQNDELAHRVKVSLDQWEWNDDVDSRAQQTESQADDSLEYVEAIQILQASESNGQLRVLVTEQVKRIS